MDTNTPPTSLAAAGRRRNQRHKAEFKRALVEQSYLPGCSVARLARDHGINANQVFAWRKLYRDSGQERSSSGVAVMLPVIVAAPLPEGETTSAMPEVMVPGGTLELVVGKARLTVCGSPDVIALRAVLALLLR
jgi:transposase